MKKSISSKTFWYRFYQKPVYTVLFILVVVICIMINFCLCCYFKLKHRRFNDEYEYTRLHNLTSAIGTDTERKERHICFNLMIY